MSMQVIDNIDLFDKPDFAVVTIGTFDGVHIGHRTILEKLVNDARANHGKTVLITFWPHPRFILKKDADKLRLLTTMDEKVALVDTLGLDYLIKIPFTPEFSTLSAEEFVKNILIDRVGTKKLFIGYDHHFGNNREGDISFLQQRAGMYGYEVEEIPRQDIDDIGVSSTKIRNALQSGDIQLANSLLGRSYSLTGTVVSGDQRGRSIGFPTANIQVAEEYKLLPGDGAYAIIAELEGGAFKGMLNIGFKPTVNGNRRTIEAHLFDFSEEIYGEQVTIRFVKSLRKEVKFHSIEALKDQLVMDRGRAIEILR